MAINKDELKVFSFPIDLGRSNLYTFAINRKTLEYNYGSDTLETMLTQNCWEAQEHDSLKDIVESVLAQAITKQAPNGWKQMVRKNLLKKEYCKTGQLLIKRSGR